jgi:hypothetical protein
MPQRNLDRRQRVLAGIHYDHRPSLPIHAVDVAVSVLSWISIVAGYDAVQEGQRSADIAVRIESATRLG